MSKMNPKQKHKHKWKFQTNIFVELPLSVFHKLTKQSLRSKDVKIMGVDWPRVRILYCNCGKAVKLGEHYEDSK